MIIEWGRIILREIVARPIMLATPFLIIGIVLSYSYDIYDTSISVAFFLVLFTLFALMIRQKSFVFLLILLIANSLVLGILSVDFAKSSNSPEEKALLRYENIKTKITGHIVTAPERSRKTTHLHVKPVFCESSGKSDKCTGKIIYYVSKGNLTLKAGDLIEITSTLREIKDNGNPGEFKYAEYLKHHGFVLRSYLRSAQSVKLIKRNDNPGLLGYFHRQRSELSLWMDSQADIENTEVLKALVIGMRKAVPEYIRESFLKGGTAHLLAISGLHLGVMAFWIFFICRITIKRSSFLMRYITANQVAALVTVPLTWFYAFLAGLHIATLRAAIMITIYLLAQIGFRRTNSVNNLFFAAFVVLILYPYSILEVGFQLSFISVLAIIVVVPRINTILPFRIRLMVETRDGLFARAVSYLYFVLLSSLICFFATAPVVIYWFHAISFAGPVVNLVIVPLFSLILIPLLAVFSILWLLGLPFAANILWISVEVFKLIFAIQESLTNLIGGLHYLPAYSGLSICLYYCALFILIFTIYPPFNMSGRPVSGVWKYVFGRKQLRVFGALLLGILAFSTSFAGIASDDEENEKLFIVPHMRKGTCVYSMLYDNELVCSSVTMDENDDPLKRTIAPMIWQSGNVSVSRLWYSSKRKNFQRFIDESEKFFNIKTNQRLYDDCIGETRNGIQVCRLNAYTTLYKVKSSKKPEGQPYIPILNYTKNGDSILILASPHLIDEKSWRMLTNQYSAEDTIVIMFGPGKIDSFANMVSRIKPKAVLLAMNQQLSRYLSKENWQKMQEILSETYRTDYDGALAIDARFNIIKLSSRL